jgi:hypothetical protein
MKAAYNQALPHEFTDQNHFFTQEISMKNGLTIALLASALFALPASAQQGPGTVSEAAVMGGKAAGQGQGKRGPVDCSKAKDSKQCKARQEAHQKMMAACKGKAGPERKQCMHEQAQNVDCSKARNPQQCESRKQTYAACKDQSGPQFKRCVQEKMPPADCSKSADAARCEQHQKARDACKDKVGPEHRQCLRDNLAPKK